MDDIPGYTKFVLIAMLIAVISFLHYGAIGANMGLHIIHRELFFIPIILACFWFGSLIGVSTAAIVCIIYFPHVFMFEDAHGTMSAVISQLLVFLIVALSIGYLIDRQRKKQATMQKLENLEVLGRAASVVEYELSTTLNILRDAFVKAGGPPSAAEIKNYRKEIDRLALMIEALRLFTPEQEEKAIVDDLNTTILSRVENLKPQAKNKHIRLKLALDTIGCPSKIHPERFGPILDDLIKNSMDVSSPGQTITVSSKRGGEFCIVSVRDTGQGIEPKNMPRIFSPFFTTKPNGHGLALAASKKYLRSMGGNITVDSELGQGTTFTLYLPREDLQNILRDIRKK